MKRLLIATSLCLWVFSCDTTNESSSSSATNGVKTPALNYSLEGSLPHDINSFTEGLFIDNGRLFESTGSPQQLPSSLSHFGIVDTLTGAIKVKASLNKDRFFGEGICIFDDKLYQLTYRSQICFIYDANSYKLLNSVVYDNAEGWGLTRDDKTLIMSDGTHILTLFTPGSFAKADTIEVTENGVPVENLNELEFVDGFIYANVWTTNIIVKIDSKSGKVVGKADFTDLYQNASQQSNSQILEMNGIAYDDTKKEFLITGKLWPKIYRIKF